MTDITLRVTIEGKNGTRLLSFNYGLPALLVSELQPLDRAFLDPADAMREQDKRDRLRRYTDMIAADIAHGFTEFMLHHEAQGGH